MIETAEVAALAESVGFVGLGIMGSRMAANLTPAGHEPAVYAHQQDFAAPIEALEGLSTRAGGPDGRVRFLDGAPHKENP